MANRTRKLLSEMQSKLDLAIRRDACAMLRENADIHAVTHFLVLSKRAQREVQKACQHAEKTTG